MSYSRLRLLPLKKILKMLITRLLRNTIQTLIKKRVLKSNLKRSQKLMKYSLTLLKGSFMTWIIESISKWVLSKRKVFIETNMEREEVHTCQEQSKTFTLTNGLDTSLLIGIILWMEMTFDHSIFTRNEMMITRTIYPHSLKGDGTLLINTEVWFTLEYS